jgi:tRNA G10  N-methylase Trm11
LIRYTGKGDWILDLFAGEGTSLIECKRWGRNGVGVELVPRVAARANQLIKAQENPRVFAEVVTGDSTSVRTKKRVKAILATHNISQVQLIILHPPYFNIIRFSNNSNDLSNAPSLQTYLQRLRQVVENFAALLEKRRYMILVIGDYYANGEYVPLAFETMRSIVNIGLFKLKGIVVKNIQGNRGKIGQEHLWRYRALKGGFYIFKHEYIFVFQKLR